MSDWLDDLTPPERADWDRFVDSVRRDAVKKMEDSAFVASIVPRGEPDVKFAVELGLAIMLGKPILAIISPGQQIPVGMRKVADEIVEADVDLAEGRELIQAAIERMMAREPRYGVCGCGAEMDEHGCPHGH